MINIFSSSRYRINRKKIKDSFKIDNYTINISFVGKNKMRSLSKNYKREEIALPVLSFPYLGEKIENENLLGEIVICYPQAVLLAAERNRRVEEIILQLIKHEVENLVK